MKKLKIRIDGMHCASCAGNIERSLRKVNGVKEAVVSVIGKKAFIQVEGNVPQEELKKAVARAGYKTIAIEE
ncbi:heavy-metal-associated domain-containing protein [Candidatus Pacearchaeota archaeon]|nr:heavy-metal-associated domain-containing protein [Candidatus Pacearchaeota archaeon]